MPTQLKKSMVQEFHVLRCFSCETFQVQQVKKAKKWTCKMCGDKQSVIKEFGRGSGADCRRHVQKLNTLRGNLLEEENQRVWSKGDSEECVMDEENTQRGGCHTQSQESQLVVESRWSKYVAEKRASSNEEVEENVSTERWFNSRRNFRKRRKLYRSGPRCNSENGELNLGQGHQRTLEPSQPPQDEDHVNSLSTMRCSPQSSVSFKETKRVTQSPKASPIMSGPTSYKSSKAASNRICSTAMPSADTGHFPILGTDAVQQSLEVTNKQTPTLFGHRPLDKPSCSQQPQGKVLQPQASKWVKFLTETPTQEGEKKEDSDYSQLSAREWGTSGMPSPDAQTSQTPSMSVSRVAAIDPNHLGPLEIPFPRGPLSEKASTGNRAKDVLDGLGSAVGHCGFMYSTNQTCGPSVTAMAMRLEKSVCCQPPSTKYPCPNFLVNPMFNTDEDFDETF